MRAVMAGQREFTIRGNGENLIDFMYIDDAVDGFLTMTAAKAFSGTIDFASRRPVSVNHVVSTMARLLGAEIHVAHEGHTEEFIQFHTVDTTLRERFAFLHDAGSFAEVSAERALLDRLGGGCHVPIGARARLAGDELRLTGVVASPDGAKLCRGEIFGLASEAGDLGKRLADQLLNQGADKLLASI